MTSKLNAALLIFALAPSSAFAGTIAISDPSFEMPVLGCSPSPGCFVYSFDGWTIASGVGSVATFAPSVGVGQEFASLPDGSQVAAISNGSGSGGEIYQDLSATLSANTTYTLTFSVGQRADLAFDPAYEVSLISGGVTLASNTGSFPAAGSFVNETVVFNSGPSPVELGDTVVIDISAPASSPGQADFDLFALSTSPATSTPEPSSLMLIGLGMTAAILLRSSRRRRARA